jgi:sugar lactone lactonase YvrE
MQFEQILDGFIFLEAPRVDDQGNLWFSEVMRGGVYRLSPRRQGRWFYYRPEIYRRTGADRRWRLHRLRPDRAGIFQSGTGERRVLEFLYRRPADRPYQRHPARRPRQPVRRRHARSCGSGRRPAALDRALSHRSVGRDGACGGWDFEISNGIGFSPDRKQLYFAETFKGPVVFDLTPDRTLANRRLLAEFSGADGLQVDAQGGIWVANYAVGNVTRFLPDGTVERMIDFSTRFDGCRITSLTFGGPDLKDLYVVTA